MTRVADSGLINMMHAAINNNNDKGHYLRTKQANKHTTKQTNEQTNNHTNKQTTPTPPNKQKHNQTRKPKQTNKHEMAD